MNSYLRSHECDSSPCGYLSKGDMLDDGLTVKTEQHELRSPLSLALDAIEVPQESWQLAALARGMLRGYDARWGLAQTEIELIAIEQVYTADLINLQTGKPSRTFRIAGKLDKLVRHEGLCIYDHKTTGSDIEDPDATYWRQLTIASQPSHYELLLHLNGLRVDRVIWDVARKPGIKPKAIAKKDACSVADLGSYCGFDLSTDAIRYAETEQRENAELYEYRVAAECIEQPQRYFGRRTAKRIQNEIAEYAIELWDMATEMREARKHSRWYRNAGACMNYGTPCRFLGVCSGHDTVESDKWTRTEQVHNELELENTDGRNLLTNSRLSCFQSCRRKHYYEYELGVRRIDEEEKESLYFGALWSRALDIYWEHTTRKGEL